MKWIIGIIVIALVAWGIWWARNNSETVNNDDNAGAVQGAQSQTASSTYDLGEFQDKG